MSNRLRGGAFLIQATAPEDVFIPENFSDDTLAVRDLALDFLRTRVDPAAADLAEHRDNTTTTRLLDEAGALGLLGTSIPEQYGGSHQDFVTNMMLFEVFSAGRSFSLSQGAHTGIGSLPTLYFGTEAQKAHYLPKLVSGEMKAAYCLTEPDSGSDALAAKSHAALSPDGKNYILNGQKMWITNGGFADVFTVFAKIDGKAFTAFIVERAWKGVTVGAEEKKLGIKGSSTCQVFFENVAVPVENVLGEIGKGHKIAFNILNIGRVKLAAGVVGASKHITGIAAKYANERQQFGQPIANFGAIQHKIGEMATRTYAIESAVYRVSNDIQTWESAGLAEGKTMNEALLAAAEEYAIECALLKVAGSECLDFAADEGLQIYGGMGYSEEAPMASIYRDARINRIFEGTNEINRMLAVDMLLKRTLRGDIDLFTHVMALQAELLAPPSFGSSASSNSDGFDAERQTVTNLKKLCLITAGATAQHFTTALETEQEILMNIADMMTAAYIAESVLLRTLRRFAEQKADAATLAIAADMTRLYVYDALERSAGYGKAVIAAWATGDEKRMLMLALRRFAKQEDINTKTMRRNVAAYYLANAPK